MNQLETLRKVPDIMTEADPNARCMRQDKIKGGLYVEQWIVGREVVVVIYYKDGGCSHFVQQHGRTWEEMSAQMRQIATKGKP